MNNSIYGKESLYFEMNSDKTETDARIYYNIVGESAAPEVEHTKFRLMCSQAASEKRQASAELSDTVIVRRMLFFMSAVAVVALVAATAALLLAAMKSRGDSSAKVQDVGGSRMIDSQYYDRTVKIAANMTALVQKMERRMQKVEQSKILERIMKNLTTGLSSTQQELDVLSQNLTYSKASQMSGLRNILKSLNDSVENTADLITKVNNISKMAGPVGPRGFNGSQGDAGLKGAMGPPGSNGAGNFSSCRYKVEAGDFTPGNPNTLASKTEPTGKRILGATCSTNFAAECNLLSRQQSSGKWRYVCTCKGTSTLFTPQKGETKHCYLHFWECPLKT